MTILITQHPEYTLMLPEVRKVRDSVQGAFFVKRQGVNYLPHPSDVDQISERALNRYTEYKTAAEFDEVPGYTMRSMLGRMALGQSTVELPNGLEYLKNSVDNDGLSLLGQAENVAANILQFKWHILLAESINSPAPGSRMTASELAALGNRAAIKSYSRESVVDWDFRKIAGAMQLSYIKLKEKKYSLNYQTSFREEYDEYLILELDDGGDYVWWRETIPANGDRVVKTEPVSVMVAGKPMKWLPVEIVADIEPPSGHIPLEMGFLSPIVDKVMARYVDSARYAEGRRSILPTVNTSGWQGNDWDDFKAMNGGREYIELGGLSVNNLPRDVEMGIMSPSTELDHFVKYRDINARDIRALGGEFSGDETAGKSDTQAGNESSDKASKMLSIVSNIEAAYKRLITYCGVLQGVYKQENIEKELDNINIKLNREFAKKQIDVERAKLILTELRMSGLFSDERILQMLKALGVFDDDLQAILDERDSGQ